jgi:hypothetical protein
LTKFISKIIFSIIMRLEDLSSLHVMERKYKLIGALVSPEYGYTLMEGKHELLYKYDADSRVLKIIDLNGFIEEPLLQNQEIIRNESDIGTLCFAFKLNDADDQKVDGESNRVIDALQFMNDYRLKNSEMFSVRDLKLTKYIGTFAAAVCATVGMTDPHNFIFAFFGSLVVVTGSIIYDGSLYKRANRAIEQDNKDYLTHLSFISRLKMEVMQSSDSLRYDAKLVSQFTQKIY